ncbi:phytoene desaturase family protein [Lapillicoccus sp.]|uniref:phytoene desaturase family protein n=1 Tax=Lapillicoccus sp. TaxID=1909287 RepID=UPI0025FF5457|nr:phytoene desaturase family protein [Lapillicoccus sp.]
MSARRAVVIGGGFAGLACAALLAREGYEVELLEKNASPGGRAGSWSQDGFRFDTGPSWYLMPEVFDHFFRLLGTTTEDQLDLVRLDPAYRVFFQDGSEPVDVRSDPAAAIALFEGIEPGAGKRLETYLASAREVYDLAVQRFLYTTYQSLLPLLRPDVLRNAVRLSRLLIEPMDRFIARSFTDNHLAQILGYPAVFLGTSPDRAPSMYHLMSHLDLADGVLYPQGGITRVVESLVALAEAEGVRIRTDAEVLEIVTAPVAGSGRWRPGADRRRARVRSVRFRDTQGGRQGPEHVLDADLVVGAADLHHIETELLPPALQTYPQSWWDRRDPGTGAVLVLLGVRGSLPQLEHHSLFFTTDWVENFDAILGSPPRVPDPASIYVCRPSATDAAVAPADNENLFVLVPMPADPGLGRGGVAGQGDARVEAIADAAIAQIAGWAGIPDLAERVVVRRTIGPGDFVTDVHAWSGGALGLGHTARQSAFLRGRNVSRRVAGLYYAGHGTIPGIGLPMCLISAEILLKAVRGDTSTEPLPTPLPTQKPTSLSHKEFA